MNASSIITALVLLLILGAAIYFPARSRGKGPACGGGCSGCPHMKNNYACGKDEVE